jgi:hypothetical protein
MGEQVTEEAEVLFGGADGEDADGAIGQGLRARRQGPRSRMQNQERRS